MREAEKPQGRCAASDLFALRCFGGAQAHGATLPPHSVAEALDAGGTRQYDAEDQRGRVGENIWDMAEELLRRTTHLGA